MLTKQTQAVLKHASLSAIWSTFMIFNFYFGRWKLTAVPSISPWFWMLITKHVKPFSSKWQELVKMEMFYSCIQKLYNLYGYEKYHPNVDIIISWAWYFLTVCSIWRQYFYCGWHTLTWNSPLYLRFEHKKFKKPNNLKSHVEFRTHICLKTQPSYTCICHWKDMSNPKFPAL